jgi:hypothetical protein
LFGEVGGGGEGAVVEDGDGVGELEEFVEVGVDEEEGGAAVAGGLEVVEDEGGGGDVEAAGGVGGEEEGFVGFPEFAGEDDFLLVAAGEAGEGDGGGGGADVEFF